MKKLTQSDLEIASERAEDMAADLRALSENLRKSIAWEDDVTTPARHTAAFASLSRAAADLTSAMLTRLAFEEDRAALEARLRARQEDTPATGAKKL